MYEHETFKNAPITEATATLQIAHPRPPTAAQFEEYAATVASGFPVKEEKTGFATSLTISGNEPIFQNVPQKFLELRSDDNKNVIQVRPNSLSYSRLKPYISWDDFVTRTLECWRPHFTLASSSAVLGISLRYVNRIDLPNPYEEADYFATRLSYAASFPNTFTNMFLAFSMRGKETDSTGNVLIFMDQRQSNPEKIATIFQIDVDKRTALTTNFEDEVISVMKSLRDFKNELFFLSITEKTKALFR